MVLPAVPRPHSELVRETERELLDMCAGENAWCAFLRGYLTHSSRRLAWNVHCVDRHLAPGASWLDIGTFGVEALWLMRRRKDIQVRGVAYEGGHVALTESCFVSGPTDTSVIAELQIDCANVEFDVLPYEDASFDVVTCFECIEHLRSTPRPMLDQILRVLKPGGRLLMTTPNVVGSRAMMRLLAGKHPQENPRYHRNPKYGIVHPREYTLRELAALLDSRGLEVVEGASLYFRRRTVADFVAAGIACITRPLGGLALGLGPQPVVVGDNLFVVAQAHTRPREDWPALLFEPDAVA
ncbi:MAG: class I SAM-dependent methyltransferase [Planctomycetota bacterium]